MNVAIEVQPCCISGLLIFKIINNIANSKLINVIIKPVTEATLNGKIDEFVNTLSQSEKSFLKL